MNKTFEIKVYNLDWTFNKLVSRSDLMKDFYYTSAINEWQGNADIELNLSIWNNDFTLWQVIKVYIFTDIYPNWKIIYSGMITKMTWKITSWAESLTLNCIWLGSLLSFIYFKSWGNYAFTLNQEPATTLKAIIDYFNTKYTGTFLNYWANVSNYGSSVNLSYSYSKCLDALKNTASATNFWWNIRSTGELYYKTTPTTATHILTVWKDIDTLTIENDSERVINEYILTYNSWTATNSDATSKTSFWLRELQESKTDIQDLASANIYGTNYISKNKDYKKKTSIVINNSYNLESIEIGDTISVVNTDLSLKNLQIRKISYNINNMVIELDEFDTLAKELISN